MKPPKSSEGASEYTTLEVARRLGMSVRSVQLMVDRGELQAWRTPGGHRRIAGDSVERMRLSRSDPDLGVAADPANVPLASALPIVPGGASTATPSVLLIDDSTHFQRLVALLMRQHFPEVALHVADDGIAGLALYGRLQPQVLIVDILLPGIDGATLITSLRSHPAFATSHLAVVTTLAERDRAPYAFALEQVPVIHKPRLVAELPPLLARWLPPAAAGRAAVA